jgi:hypothetical protein
VHKRFVSSPCCGNVLRVQLGQHRSCLHPHAHKFPDIVVFIGAMDTAIASSTPSELPTDPVSSLRAVALSTLKAKRRKPQADRNVNLPARPPPPTDTLHLDYGAEDGPQDVTMQEPSILPMLPGQTSHQHAREEGEISEEDEPPPAKSTVKTPLAILTPSVKSITPEPRQILEADQPRHTTPLPMDNLPTAQTVAPPDSSRGPSSAISRTPDAPMEGVFLTESHLVLSPLGLDYIRPGLQCQSLTYIRLSVFPIS